VSENSKDVVSVEANSSSSYNLATALIEIDKKYQEQIYNFMTQLHNLNSEIDNFKNEIKTIQESIETEEQELQELNTQIKAELLHLEKLNETFLKKASIALEVEKLDVSNSVYKDMIEELDEEIRELEIDILQKELQKENLQLKIMPSLQKIAELKSKIKELEAQKRYIESLGVQKQIAIQQQKELPNDIVDINAE
jgi:chromosome segregation ATPase